MELSTTTGEPQPAQPLLLQLTGLVGEAEPAGIPREIRDRYADAILDLVGAMLLGRDTPTARVFAAVAGGSGDGALLSGAAADAAAAHALELDDVHIDVTGWHPSVAIVSPLLALGRARHFHGRDILRGVISGWELGGRIGAAMTPAHRARGFHATGTIGALAAAASVARASGLDAEATSGAMALAASMAGGTFGILAGAPEAKHLHAAHGVMAGVYAVQLTEGGLRGPLGTLEAPEGFFTAYADGKVDRGRLLRPLGEPWEIERQMVKPHACCGHAFGAIDAADELRRSRDFDPQALERIEVYTYDAAAVLTERHPKDPVSARLSVPWCVAQALSGEHPEGLLSMDAFTDESLSRDDLHAIADKVHVLAWGESNEAFPGQRRTRIVADGVGDAEVHYTRGMPERPVGREALRTKFRTLVASKFGNELAAAVEGLVDDIDDTPDWVARFDAIVGHVG